MSFGEKENGKIIQRVSVLQRIYTGENWYIAKSNQYWPKIITTTAVMSALNN